MKAIKGISSVSKCLCSIIDKKRIIVYSVPVFKGNRVIGVLSAINQITTIEKSFFISKYNLNYNTYIINSNGDIILKSKDTNDSNINILSTINNYGNNIDKFVKDIKNRDSNVRIIKDTNSKHQFVTYAPLEKINDWYLVSFVAQTPILKKSNYIITLTASLVALITFLLLIFFFYISFVRKSSRKTFEYLAYTDDLTGCRNWSKFVIDSLEMIKKSKDKQYAFVFSNIENFKYVNDIMGFEVGNDLLKFFSKTLDEQLEIGEPYTRINADRFGFIMEYTNDQALLNRLKKINDEISSFKSHSDIRVTLNVLYGIYKVKDKSLPISIMSDRALLAMQTIKTSRESNYGFYNSSIRQKALLEKQLESDMQEALDNKNFAVYLQPKFDLNTKKIIGAEALVRWLHPKRGIISPNEFIPLFENNGFITKLDYYMFESACKLLRKWIDKGKTPIPVSVNISRVHLYNQNLAEELYCTALRYDIPPKLIEIELTESIDFENISLLLQILYRLKSFDFTISIDDFGSGYSSLNLLKDLPVDILKIDREFLSQASDQKRGRQVIASIIDLAKHLDIKTVAEGVEQKDQADFLTSANCDFVQGFYFSKPICINDFEKKYIN